MMIFRLCLLGKKSNWSDKLQGKFPTWRGNARKRRGDGILDVLVYNFFLKDEVKDEVMDKVKGELKVRQR